MNLRTQLAREPPWPVAVSLEYCASVPAAAWAAWAALAALERREVASAAGRPKSYEASPPCGLPAKPPCRSGRVDAPAQGAARLAAPVSVEAVGVAAVVKLPVVD